MARYLTADNRWSSYDDAPELDKDDLTAKLVQGGLLHESYLSDSWLAGDFLKESIPWSTNYVRLTDGPGGVQRWASYYDVVMTNPWAYGTVHTIARGLARLPLKLYEPQSQPEGDQAIDPRTIQRVIGPDRSAGNAGKIAWGLRYPNSIPNDDKSVPNSPPSRRALMYGTAIAKLVHGNAIWEIRKGNAGILGFQLHPIENVIMDEDLGIYEVHPANFGVRFFDEMSKKGNRVEPRVLTPDKVCHFGLWESGRRPWNPSPIRALHASIALYDAVTRHMVAFFNSGARLSGHLKVDTNTSPKSRELVRQEILKLYSGPENAGKVLVSSGDWQAFSREPQFDGIVNLIKFSRDEIFVTYGVPPPVMGVMDRAIMANVREMRDQYVRDLIGPHAEFIAGDFEAQVIDREPKLVERNIFCEFDIDEQLRPTLWQRASSFRNLMLLYTPDEARQIERLPALRKTGSDTIWRPLNEGPLGNMPDYLRKEEREDRKVEIQAKSAEQPKEAPKPPADDDSEEETNSE